MARVLVLILQLCKLRLRWRCVAFTRLRPLELERRGCAQTLGCAPVRQISPANCNSVTASTSFYVNFDQSVMVVWSPIYVVLTVLLQLGESCKPQPRLRVGFAKTPEALRLINVR